MSIGDCIPFRYKASTSGVVGNIAELGTCTATEIPVIGSATPNGLAYFIKADKGLLIADRVVQHSIAWNTLNKAGYIEGKQKIALKYINNIVPISILGSYHTGELLPVLQDNNTYSGLTIIKPTTGDSFTILFQNAEIINSIIVGGAVSDSNATPRYVTVKGVDDGDNVTTIYTYDNTIPINTLKIINFNNNIAYKKYIIHMSNASNSSAYGFDTTELCLGYNIGIEYGLLRSLTGGNSYLGLDGKAGLTDKSLGVYPIINEWDKYIVNSDLNGKITPGDDNIWHSISIEPSSGVVGHTLVKDTPILNLIPNGSTVGCTSAYKNCRANLHYLTSVSNSTTFKFLGFRPVLQYIEQGSKQTNLYY
jgi:hypothetical protein